MYRFHSVLLSLQEVVGCADVCAKYSDHLWLAVGKVAVGTGSRCGCLGTWERAVMSHVTDACDRWRLCLSEAKSSCTPLKDTLKSGTVSCVCNSLSRPETLTSI